MVGKEFDSAILKYQACCLHMRSIPGFTGERVRAHQMFVSGVLFFLAQLVELPRRVSVVEAAAIAGILAAPMNAIAATGVASSSSCARGMRFVHLELQCRAVSEGLDSSATRLPA